MAPISKSKTFLSALPDLRYIQECVNNRYDSLFRQSSDGALLPFVCCVCDEFLVHRDDFRTITVKKMESAQSLLSWEKCPAEHRIGAIQEYYVFGDLSHKSLKKHSCWVEKLALSPRGCMFQKAKGCQVGFLSCVQCKEAIDNNEMPLFAIRNGNYCGPAPLCLLDLNEVELSFLQPEKTHGVCHVWNGGKQLKGNMTFMRVKERRVATAAAALEAKGLCKNVVVLCHGKMTDWQRKRYSERTKVRTDKLIEAARWLCKNNATWKGIDFDKLVEDLRNSNVIRIDRSTHVETSNTGTEEEEIFTCYYPDGVAETNSGGFDEPGAFKKFVEELGRSGFDLEMTANLQKEFVKENASDQLLGSCLIQFPYGICGLDEKRMRRNGSMTNNVSIPDYIRHLSLLSNPTFQTAMIQLVMHNMICRQRLLTASRLQVRGEHKAKAIANGLNYSDLHNTIQS